MNEKQFPCSSGAVCIYGICHTAFSEPPRVLASMDKQLLPGWSKFNDKLFSVGLLYIGF